MPGRIHLLGTTELFFTLFSVTHFVIGKMYNLQALINDK